MEVIKYVVSKVFSKLGACCISMLLLVFAFQNCGRFQALPVGNSTELASTSGAVLDGKALYTQNCASCHGPVEASAKRSRTADQITLALSSQPLMGAIHLTQ